MKLPIKNITKRFLGLKKVRKILWFLFTPLSFLVIKYYGNFDFDWYESQFVGEDKWLKNQSIALVHYILYGRRRGLTPNPFFVPEYFDSRNWRDSIIDPLTRYLIYKKNWELPTSVLFHPQNYRINISHFKSPLAVFLSKLNDDTKILIDNQHKDLTWSDTKGDLYNANKIYKQQELLRSETSPVYSFNYALEKKQINKYRNFAFSDNRQPLVSIIMPVWNRQELVVDAIKSVQAQTFSNWELVITDDGSSDNSVEVIEGMMKDDSRIKLLQPGHGGVCRARNSSLAESSGKWVAFLDSDNTWLPDYLQTIIGSLVDSGHEAAYSAIKMESHGKARYRTTQPNPELLSVGNYIDLNALVVRRTIIDKVGFFDESLRRMVDYDLVCRINKVTEFIYVPIIGVLYTDHDDVARITTTELTSWDGVIKSKNFIDWSASLRVREKGLTSIVLTVSDDIRTAMRALRSIESDVAELSDIEIIIADSSSSAALGQTIRGYSQASKATIRHIRFPASHDNTLGSNYGYSASRGSTVVFISQYITIEPGALPKLIESSRKNSDKLVAPVQIKNSRLIHSAGEVKGGGDEFIRLLEEHPFGDLRNLDEQYEVPLLTSGCVAMGAETFTKLHGFNPLYSAGFEMQDLSLRAREIGAETIVDRQSIVTNLNETYGQNTKLQDIFYDQWNNIDSLDGSELWIKAGFEVSGYRGSGRPKLKVAKGKGLRWAIKISSPSDERRLSWGDTYYAEALAAALERLGQAVAIDYHDYHDRSTAYLDDVNLDLRGLDNFVPAKGKTNIMWVISHPEKVTTQMVKSFDKVYAAGSKWAQYMSEESGKKVDFLPQCTDPEVFKPTQSNPEFANKIIFVGNSRNVMRPIIRDSIAAGVDVAVYGGGWEGLIDRKYIKGRFIPNHKLAEAYSSAKVVLNDHWDDMRRWGFLSNRLFDAASSGANVITDNIAGIEDVFVDGIVRTYTTQEDLSRAIDKVRSSEKINLAQRYHSYIKSKHSFDARAQELVNFVKSR